MSTVVAVNTYTHSIAYLSDKMLTSLKRIILWSGLDPSKLTGDWALLDRGIRTWLNNGELRAVTLEVYRPVVRTLVGRWDFDIAYSYGADDDGEMWVDTDAIRFAIKKCGIDPGGCDYRIIADTKPNRAHVDGWGPTEYLATTGFVRQGIGTTIGAGSLASRVDYWRRT